MKSNIKMKINLFLKTHYSIRFIFGGFLFFLFAFLNLSAESLAGRTFNRTIAQDFSFDPPYGDFAGITYNPLTQTYFVTDNVLDAMFEIQSNGTLIRTIDINGLKRPGIATADAEGIAWMRGQTFALALHDGKELAVVNIVPTTTILNRGDAIIYNMSSGPGKPKGLTYVGPEDAFYWVTKDIPKAVVKSRINIITGNLDTLSTKNVDVLPASNLADIAFFPRLSAHTFLISESSKTVMEVDLSGLSVVLKSSFSLTGAVIPKAGGVTFGADGKMYIVGKHMSATPEDDFTVFSPTAPITNRVPNPRIKFESTP
ncbi:MAG: SdiA-regulated domain-containing protein [Elusimicrobiota bacterium]